VRGGVGDAAEGVGDIPPTNLTASRRGTQDVFDLSLT